MNVERYDIAVCGSGVWRRRDSFRAATAQCEPLVAGGSMVAAVATTLGRFAITVLIFVVVAMSHGLAVLWTLGGFVLARATAVRIGKGGGMNAIAAAVADFVFPGSGADHGAGGGDLGNYGRDDDGFRIWPRGGSPCTPAAARHCWK